jgi:hypothetical protein
VLPGAARENHLIKWVSILMPADLGSGWQLRGKGRDVMDTGVKVVGAKSTDDESSAEPADASTMGRSAGRFPADQPQVRKLFMFVSVLAVLGMVGTAVFGLLWAGSGGSATTDPAMVNSAKTFLIDLTNFNAKTLDADFRSITSMATGSFSGQADKFFNSSIRTALQDALAESRGQIRDIFVQSFKGNQAVVYAVVDQVYVNNKISTPQSDVLRVLVNLQKVGSTWKISDVTVLEGATPASTGTASGSAGSAVPGQ